MLSLSYGRIEALKGGLNYLHIRFHRLTTCLARTLSQPPNFASLSYSSNLDSRMRALNPLVYISDSASANAYFAASNGYLHFYTFPPIAHMVINRRLDHRLLRFSTYNTHRSLSLVVVIMDLVTPPVFIPDLYTSLLMTYVSPFLRGLFLRLASQCLLTARIVCCKHPRFANVVAPSSGRMVRSDKTLAGLVPRPRYARYLTRWKGFVDRTSESRNAPSLYLAHRCQPSMPLPLSLSTKANAPCRPSIYYSAWFGRSQPPSIRYGHRSGYCLSANGMSRYEWGARGARGREWAMRSGKVNDS